MMYDDMADFFTDDELLEFEEYFPSEGEICDEDIAGDIDDLEPTSESYQHGQYAGECIGYDRGYGDGHDDGYKKAKEEENEAIGGKR